MTAIDEKALPWDADSWQNSGPHRQMCRLQLALLRADDALRAIQHTCDVQDVRTHEIALRARAELRECIEGRFARGGPA